MTGWHSKLMNKPDPILSFSLIRSCLPLYLGFITGRQRLAVRNNFTRFFALHSTTTVSWKTEKQKYGSSINGRNR